MIAIIACFHWLGCWQKKTKHSNHNIREKTILIGLWLRLANSTCFCRNIWTQRSPSEPMQNASNSKTIMDTDNLLHWNETNKKQHTWWKPLNCQWNAKSKWRKKEPNQVTLQRLAELWQIVAIAGKWSLFVCLAVILKSHHKSTNLGKKDLPRWLSTNVFKGR